MRFTALIQQNVPGLNVTMQDAMLMCVLHGARNFCNQLYRSPDWHGLACDHFIELATFDELHAEVTLGIALADFVDGDNPRMLEMRGSFGFPAKALQVRFSGPWAKA